MKRFADLYTSLDQTTKINVKIDALATYFTHTDPEDVIWAVALLTGRRPKRAIKTNELVLWSQELANLPSWIFFESHLVVGDLAETITLVLPPPTGFSSHTLKDIMDIFKCLDQYSDEERKASIQQMWMEMSTQERLVFNKLITGSFRVGVSQQLVVKALAKCFHLDENVVSHRLMGNWSPYETTLDTLLKEENLTDNISKPYPFYLAYQLDLDLKDLGNLEEWQVERKYDGIRGQVIVRDGHLFVWSRGEDLMTDKFPEFEPLTHFLPSGTVLDGEILPFKGEVPMPFHVMQTRIGRKNVTKKFLTEAPLAIMCYDLLEYEGKDIRTYPMRARRQLLEQLVKTVVGKEPQLNSILKLSPVFSCSEEEELIQLRMQSQEFMCEGLMLKHLDSPYEAGRRRGRWWKWKIDPYTIDGVLVYAQRGHGRRANLYTDYTFAVWAGDELVPFTKAYSGLTDKELVEVDAWVKKKHTGKIWARPECHTAIGFRDRF